MLGKSTWRGGLGLTNLAGVCAVCLFLSMYAVDAYTAGEAGGHLDVGPEVHYFKYEEPDIMEDKGVMWGIFGRYIHRFQQNEAVSAFKDLFSSTSKPNLLGAEAKLSFGQVDYESVNTGTIDNIDDFLYEMRFWGGYDFPVAGSLLTPYLGLGYRYWYDDLGGKTSTTGHSGYDRESNYIYLPIGIATETPLQSGWSVGFAIEYDVFLDGQQKSHLEDVSSSLSTLENDQNDGFGVRGAITLVKENPNWDLLIEPFVRYWDIDDSSVSAVTCGGVTCAFGYEPKNKTVEAGARVAARF